MPLDSLMPFIRENWMILILVFFLKPDIVYTFINKIAEGLKLKKPDKPDDDGELDLLDLLSIFVRENKAQNLGADDAIQQMFTAISKADGATSAKKK